MDREFLIDLFADFGPVAIRKMFSGYGISADGINFALALRAGLFFRADEVTIPDFEAEGSKPFQYSTRAKTVLVNSYWELPARLFDDSEELAQWARAALAAAQRAKVKKRPRKKAARSLRKRPRRRSPLPRSVRPRKQPRERCGRVGKAKRAHDLFATEIVVGTALARLCPPYETVCSVRGLGQANPHILRHEDAGAVGKHAAIGYSEHQLAAADHAHGDLVAHAIASPA